MVHFQTNSYISRDPVSRYILLRYMVAEPEGSPQKLAISGHCEEVLKNKRFSVLTRQSACKHIFSFRLPRLLCSSQRHIF